MLLNAVAAANLDCVSLITLSLKCSSIICMKVMENKQLDFNQPFLSVRRVLSMEETSTKANETARRDNNRWPPLPVYKSELKCGPVRNQGNVPFLWEHVPGRPKNGRKSETIVSKPPSAAAKRSPGMSSDSKQQQSSKEPTSGAATLSHKSIAKFRTLRESIERDCHELDDEAYVEANDTVSRSESFSMNCSVTGLSGLDVDGDVKPSETFSKDKQTRDFMMGRFLPAAKALASETPQVSHRKQSVQREQQREARKVVEMDKEHRVNSLPTTLPPYYPPPNPHNDEEINKDDDTNLDESEYSSTKACGLFTRFCLRGSFCLLHPVPGMKTQGSAPALPHRVQNDNLTHSSCSNIKVHFEYILFNSFYIYHVVNLPSFFCVHRILEMRKNRLMGTIWLSYNKKIERERRTT